MTCRCHEHDERLGQLEGRVAALENLIRYARKPSWEDYPEPRDMTPKGPAGERTA